MKNGLCNMHIYVFIRRVCGCESNLPSLHPSLEVVFLKLNIKLARAVVVVVGR